MNTDLPTPPRRLPTTLIAEMESYLMYRARHSLSSLSIPKAMRVYYWERLQLIDPHTQNTYKQVSYWLSNNSKRRAGKRAYNKTNSVPRPEAGQQEEERNDQVQLQNQKGGQTGEQGGETQVADQQEQEAQPGEEEKAETLVQEESQLPPIGVPYQEQDPTFVDCFEPTEEVLSLLDLPAFFP